VKLGGPLVAHHSYRQFMNLLKLNVVFKTRWRLGKLETLMFELCGLQKKNTACVYDSIIPVLGIYHTF
jgi:hypothetical protein